MALVKFGGGVLDIRGSIGGNVFSRNRFGAYLRARVAPVNPQSPRQSAIRALLSLIAVRWTFTLSQANRDSWKVFADNVPTTNKLGETIHLTGFNQFMKSNLVSANAALPFIDAAPVIFALPGEDNTFAVAIDAGTGKITVTFDDTRDWADEDEAAMVVEMGLPANPTIEFFDGPWRSAGSIEGDSVAAPTSPDATIDVPFEVGDGQKVFVRAKILRADGRVSDWFRNSGVVATA